MVLGCGAHDNLKLSYLLLYAGLFGDMCGFERVLLLSRITFDVVNHLVVVGVVP